MGRIPPVFCGNFEYDAPAREIERMFDRYGPVDRLDMKTGFAFVYMRDRRDAEDAIRALDRREWGLKRRILKVEWAKGDGEVKQREEVRRKVTKPATTLFVVNFDVERTRERDLERHFDVYGRLKRVQVKRNYAFVQYESLEDAIDAQKATHLSNFNGRTISVEFVSREADGTPLDPDDRRRSRSRSPRRRARSRSPSYGRRSPSPRRSPPPRRSRSPVRRSRSETPLPRRSRSRSPRRSDSRSPVRRSLSRSRSPL